MNSFTHIARGIEAEVARQIGIWESGGTVEQHTYDFDVGRARSRRGGRRRRPTTTGTSPSPTSCRSSRRRSSSSGCGASCRSCRRSASRASPGTLDHDRALVLVTGGLDALWQATVDAGAEPVAASNVIANQLVAAGVDAAAVDAGELARLVEARERIPRGVHRGDGEGRRRRFSADPVPRAGGGLGQRARSSRSSTRSWPPTPAQVEQYRGGKDGLLGSSSAR